MHRRILMKQSVTHY